MCILVIVFYFKMNYSKPNSAQYDLTTDAGKIKWNSDIDAYYKNNNLVQTPIFADNIYTNCIKSHTFSNYNIPWGCHFLETHFKPFIGAFDKKRNENKTNNY